MKPRLTFLFVILLMLTGCGGAVSDQRSGASANNSSSDKQKELELKEKELQLKEQELKLKEGQTNSANNSVSTSADKNPNSDLSNIERLIGAWFMPHQASTKIIFTRDGRFEFNDYNAKTDQEELLTGKYELRDGNLTLLYDDRAKQTFKFYRGEKGDTNYYIRKGDYYFVKE